MDLFRPFLAKKARLSTFSTAVSQPETILLFFMHRLGVLVNTYYNTYAGLPEACTVAWVHGPMYLAPAILRYDRDSGWETRFFRSIEACRDLLRAHAALEAFLRAILGMAIAAGLFSVTETVDHLDDLTTEREDGCRRLCQMSASSWITIWQPRTSPRRQGVCSRRALTMSHSTFRCSRVRFDLDAPPCAHASGQFNGSL